MSLNIKSFATTLHCEANLASMSSEVSSPMIQMPMETENICNNDPVSNVVDVKYKPAFKQENFDNYPSYP